MAGARKKRVAEGTGAGVSSIALLASILANLKQYGDKEELSRSVQALQRLVQDWQFAYGSLDAQLALALRTNEEQTRLITSLRDQLRRVQDRANDAERRLLEVEAARNAALKRSHKVPTKGRPESDS